MLCEVEVLDAQIGGLLHARAGVVEEQDQRPVAEREASVAWHATEQRLDLVAFEEVCLRRRDALDRDRGDLLADSEHLRRSGGDVLEQAVDRGEPLVAGADVVAAVLFEVSQEREDPLQGEILERQARDPAALLRGEEHEQQPDRVAVAAHRTRAQSVDRDQVVEEVGVQELPERLCCSSRHLRPDRFGERFEATVGFLEQRRRDRQVDRGRGRGRRGP